MRNAPKAFPVLWLPLCMLLALCAAYGNAHARYDAAKAREVITEMGEKVAADPEIPGISIAVLQKGEDEPVTAAFGVACIENATPMTADSRFKIGSVTKVFTAALIHRFIEEGKVDYTTPIDRFFPDFPNEKAITVRNLLEHTSGIVDMLALAAVRENMAKPWTPEELIAMAGEHPLKFQPGTDQAYSNTGFLMLAVICERLSGLRYDELARRVFFEELGMKSVVAGDDRAVVPHLACGYSSAGEGSMTLPMMASLAAAKGTGNLEATPGDVARLVNLDRMLKKDMLDTAPLAPLQLQDGRAALVASKSGEYSMGEIDGCSLFTFRNPEMTLVGKLGSFPGFGTAFLYDRQTKTAVAISVNNERVMPRVVSLGADILNALRDLPRF